MKLFDKVAIIGVGLIGGSVGMGLKEKGIAGSVIGIGRHSKKLEAAIKLGAIDEFSLDFEDGVKDADLVIIATPVSVIAEVVKRISKSLKKGAIITDAGSTKLRVVSEVEKVIGEKNPFVGSHPMAGSEKSGVKNGSGSLFENSICIITKGRKFDQTAAKKVESLWQGLGAEVTYLTPEEHDYIIGAVSHLPHLAAAVLVETVGSLNAQDKRFFDLAGEGFKDSTRISSGEPVLWKDILSHNKENLIKLIDIYKENLDKFKSLIAEENQEHLSDELSKVKKWRDSVG